MFDEELLEESHIDPSIKIVIDKNNRYFHYPIDINYVPKYLQGLGLAKLILLKAVVYFGLVLLEIEPANHNATNIIQSILLNELIYANQYDDYFLIISKEYDDILNLLKKYPNPIVLDKTLKKDLNL